MKGKNQSFNGKVSLLDIFSPLQSLKEPESMPAHSQIQNEILQKRIELSKLEQRQSEINQKMKDEPLLFFRNLVYEIEYEKINDKKIKLNREIDRLSQSLTEHYSPAMNLHPLTAPISRGKHSLKYVPLGILNEHKKVRDELSEIQDKLEKLYEQKSIIYQEIRNSPTGIANDLQRLKLNELDMFESSLSAREEDLEKDVWNGSLQTRSNIPLRMHDFSKIMKELNNSRVKKAIEKEIRHPDSGLTIEEEEQLDELYEIRRRDRDKEIKDELER